MPSFEEEAFSRAQQMHRGVPNYSGANASARNRAQNNTNANANEKQSKSAEVMAKPEEAEKTRSSQQNTENPLNIIFQNKEQSLLLILIVLLMEEKADPTLLLALIYLLI